MNNLKPNNNLSANNLLTILKNLFKSKELRKSFKEVFSALKGLSDTFDAK